MPKWARRKGIMFGLDRLNDVARQLPTLPDPKSPRERGMLLLIKAHGWWGYGWLPKITFDELVKGLWEIYNVSEEFRDPDTSVLLARGIAWEVIEPSETGIDEVTSLAKQYDTAVLLSYPTEMLDANLRDMAAARAVS